MSVLLLLFHSCFHNINADFDSKIMTDTAIAGRSKIYRYSHSSLVLFFCIYYKQHLVIMTKVHAMKFCCVDVVHVVLCCRTVLLCCVAVLCCCVVLLYFCVVFCFVLCCCALVLCCCAVMHALLFCAVLLCCFVLCCCAVLLCCCAVL